MKRLFGSIVASLFAIVFASAVFAQAPREIAPPMEVSPPQEEAAGPKEVSRDTWNALPSPPLTKTEKPPVQAVGSDKVRILVAEPQPSPSVFPNVQSVVGTVIYAREGVHLANPFNVSFLASPLFRPHGNLEEIIRREFPTRDIPIPLPLLGGKKHLLLRVEVIGAGTMSAFVMYYTPVENVLFDPSVNPSESNKK
ncbi:MAG: hypothetical protein HYY92_00535 [Parcubacteria group bacterium]|nr:hypothetical protein [Parcubacteria group bacterium]